MNHKKQIIFFFILLASTGCSSFSKKEMKTSTLRVPSSIVKSQNIFEKELIHLTSLILDNYCEKKYVIEVVNSDEAIDIHVVFDPSDRQNVIGFGGVRIRSLRVLINELSISHSRQTAKLQGLKFDIAKRKISFIHFSAGK